MIFIINSLPRRQPFEYNYFIIYLIKSLLTLKDTVSQIGLNIFATLSHLFTMVSNVHLHAVSNILFIIFHKLFYFRCFTAKIILA